MVECSYSYPKNGQKDAMDRKKLGKSIMKEELKVGDLARVQRGLPHMGIKVGDLVLIVGEAHRRFNPPYSSFFAYETIHQRAGQKRTLFSHYLEKINANI